MFGNILLILVFVLAPAVVLWLCGRVQWLGKIGPVLILYILGIIIGNVWHPSGAAQIQDILSSATVPIAIPLMLFGCTFHKGQTKGQVLAVISGLVAVIIAVCAGYLLFGREIEDGAKIGGMLTGVYTGGTINMASLQRMLGVPELDFILLNSYDMVISFLYLTFLIAVGIKWFRKFLPYKGDGSEAEDIAAVDHKWKGLRDFLKDMWLPLVATAVIVGISAGLGLLAGDEWFMTVFILTLTTLGIAGSFVPRLRNSRFSSDVAMYCIYIFSIVVASMADLSKLDVSGGLNMLGYLTLVVFGSLLLSVLFARLLKVDADTMVITSTAFICSPPFVPMMSAAMDNRKVLLGGLTAGIIGYAIGNYLGFAMARLLPLLG